MCTGSAAATCADSVGWGAVAEELERVITVTLGTTPLAAPSTELSFFGAYGTGLAPATLSTKAAYSLESTAAIVGTRQSSDREACNVLIFHESLAAYSANFSVIRTSFAGGGSDATKVAKARARSSE